MRSMGYGHVGNMHRAIICEYSQNWSIQSCSLQTHPINDHTTFKTMSQLLKMNQERKRFKCFENKESQRKF